MSEPVRTLLLFRHAKSAWDDASLDDHDRPLAPRGVRAARAMGRWLAREGLIPDHALCSTSRRTRQTWELVTEAFDREVPCELEPALYLASPGEMLACIQEAPDEASTLVVLGHNPGTHQIALALPRPHDAPREADGLRAKFPTAAVAVLAFEEERWRDVRPGTGTLLRFAHPRNLADDAGDR